MKNAARDYRLKVPIRNYGSGNFEGNINLYAAIATLGAALIVLSIWMNELSKYPY